MTNSKPTAKDAVRGIMLIAAVAFIAVTGPAGLVILLVIAGLAGIGKAVAQNNPNTGAHRRRGRPAITVRLDSKGKP